MNAHKQRLRFEAWARGCGFGLSETGGQYLANDTFGAWEAWQYLASQAQVPDRWRPISDAPEGKLCVVGWIDTEDHEERHEFDYIEDGCWVKHAEFVEHAEAVAPAGSRLPSRDAPYRWFIEVPPMLAAATAPEGA